MCRAEKAAEKAKQAEEEAAKAEQEQRDSLIKNNPQLRKELGLDDEDASFQVWIAAPDCVRQLVGVPDQLRQKCYRARGNGNVCVTETHQ